MEEGAKSKRTVFVGGVSEELNESTIYEHFATFGDIIEVQLPRAPINNYDTNPKHRGFAFVTYAAAGDAQDAIDNMDLNEMRGRVIRVNLARAQKVPTVDAGNRPVWETEEWLQQYAKPLAQSGGVGARAATKPSEDTPDDDQATGDNDAAGGEAMEE